MYGPSTPRFSVSRFAAILRVWDLASKASTSLFSSALLSYLNFRTGTWGAIGMILVLAPRGYGRWKQLVGYTLAIHFLTERVSPYLGIVKKDELMNG